MKPKTGLKTIDGVTRHTPQVVLFQEDFERILEWLPKLPELTDENLRANLEHCMNAAKADADKFNRMADEDRQRFSDTGTRGFEV